MWALSNLRTSSRMLSLHQREYYLLAHINAMVPVRTVLDLAMCSGYPQFLVPDKSIFLRWSQVIRQNRTETYFIHTFIISILYLFVLKEKL